MHRLTSQKNLEIAPSLFFVCINRSTSSHFFFFFFQATKTLNLTANGRHHSQILASAISVLLCPGKCRPLFVSLTFGNKWTKICSERVCASTYVRISYCVKPLGLSINTNMFFAGFLVFFLMLFEAAPVGPRLWLSPSPSLCFCNIFSDIHYSQFPSFAV